MQTTIQVITLPRDTRTIRAELKAGRKVYFRNSLINMVHNVIDARTRKGQFQVRSSHPIHAGWYTVDKTDGLFGQLPR